MMRALLKNDKGLALVFALWILVFLTVITGSFSFMARKNSESVFYRGLHTKARYIAQAGIEAAINGMIDSGKNKFQPVYRVNVLSPLEPFGEGKFQVFISNDSGKVNINEAENELIRLLLNRSGLSDHEKDIIVDSILDWRDNDNLSRLNGAENSYYSSLTKPYKCRNGNFIIPDELLKVRGVTPEIYESCFRGKISVKVDENELLPLKSGIQEYLQLENREVRNGIQTFLTLEKRRESNRLGKLYDHSRININAASPRLLLALPGMTERLVEQILEFRKDEDFTYLEQVKNIIGEEIYKGIEPLISLSLSRYYTFCSTAKVDGYDVVYQAKMDIWLDNKDYDGYKILQRY